MSRVIEYLRSLGLMLKEGKPARRYVVNVPPEKLREVVSGLVSLGLKTYISTISGVDYINEGVIEVNYCLWVIDERLMIILKVRVSRDSPRIPTIHDIVPGALNGELEAYDLLGVVFEGNNKLRRAFLAPTDMVSQDIYPLRKDFKV